MKPSARTLYERIQSSDDSEEQPPYNETPHSQPHNTPSSSSSSSSPSPRIPAPLQTLTSHTSTPKKTVMIEIKGKTPPHGQDGVHALTHDQPRIVQTNPSPSDTTLMTPVAFLTERLVDTQTSGRSSSMLDRVKRLQERARGMVDMKEGMQERMRERCFGRSYGKRTSQRFCGGEERKSMLFHDDVVAEKPALEMEATRDGVLKVSDRSFCENEGCEALLRAIKNNDKLVELDLSGCNIYKGDDLARIIRSATSLKRLSLEWNSLGLARTGISALSSAISSNRSLKEVDLRSNRIGPSTAAALAHALQCNCSLTCLGT